MNEEVKLNLFQKLAKIRADLIVPKSGYNSHGKYHFYKIDDIYSAAKKAFAEYNIFTIPSLKYDSETLHYKAVLTVIDADEPQSFFETSIDSSLNKTNMSMTPCQIIGSNNTYQMKYAFMNLLMVDDGSEDPDTKKHEEPFLPEEVVQIHPSKDPNLKTAYIFHKADLENSSTKGELIEAWKRVPRELQASLLDIKDVLRDSFNI